MVSWRGSDGSKRPESARHPVCVSQARVTCPLNWPNDARRAAKYGQTRTNLMGMACFRQFRCPRLSPRTLPTGDHPWRSAQYDPGVVSAQPVEPDEPRDVAPYEDRPWDVLLVGGVSGVGKSRFVEPLARRLGVGITDVDDIQTVLKTVTAPEQQPLLHFWRTDWDAFAALSDGGRVATSCGSAGRSSSRRSLRSSPTTSSSRPTVLCRSAGTASGLWAAGASLVLLATLWLTLPVTIVRSRSHPQPYGEPRT